MALFDSADILSRIKALLNRPTTDEVFSDAQLYQFAGDAQRRVVSLIAMHCPEAMYGAPTLLSTSDSGATYTFGSGVSPIGHIELRESPTGAMIPPASSWDNTTLGYLFEAEKIRWPGQKTRTFADGPYCRFITMPGVLDGSTAPTLKPEFARELIVYDACERAAIRSGGIDPAPYAQMFNVRWPEILQAIVTAHHGAGGVAVQGGVGGVWWSGFRS